MVRVHYRFGNDRKVQYREFRDHSEYVGWLNEMPNGDYVVVVKWEVR